MLVRFWGTRGSLPVALRAEAVEQKVRSALKRGLTANLRSEADVDEFVDGMSFAETGTYGGSSSCVEIDNPRSHEVVVCDAGSGLRELGVSLSEEHRTSGVVVNLFLSHPHWDHIMGFPFFTPAYVPGNTIRIFGCHDSIESVLRTQNSAPYFPVDFSALGANIEFHTIEPGQPIDVAGLRVTPALQRHGGRSYGYRFEHDDGVVVYSTDGEHKLEQASEIEQVVAFFKDADVVIFDAMYSLADAISVREDWGHSSNLVGVDLCLRAGVRHYCMFHHEPIHDDATLDRILKETRRYEELSRGEGQPLLVSTAYDGMEIVL